MKSVLLVDKDKFEEMVRFAMKAAKDGVPEGEIWATLEVMSSEKLQTSIEESNRDLLEGRVKRFDSPEDARQWLKSLQLEK